MSSKHKKQKQILLVLLFPNLQFGVGISLRTNLVIILVLIISSIFCFLSNSWLIIWALLELNTLSFCSLIKISDKREIQKINEIAIKYLIVQIIASGILLIATSWSRYLGWALLLIYFLGPISIMVKSASAPFHQWFVNVSKYSKWAVNRVLFTWQKIAPLYLIIFQLKSLLVNFIFLSVLIGSLSIINKKNLKEILAYSSVFNLGWMIMAICIRTKLFLLFSFLYWFSVLILLNFLIKFKVRTIEESRKKIKKWLILSLIANLAGIPPLVGFIAKWIVFSASLTISLLVVTTTLLIIRTVNFYVYLRRIRNRIIKNTEINQKGYEKSQWKFYLLFLFLNSLTILRVSL